MQTIAKINNYDLRRMEVIRKDLDISDGDRGFETRNDVAVVEDGNVSIDSRNDKISRARRCLSRNIAAVYQRKDGVIVLGVENKIFFPGATA